MAEGKEFAVEIHENTNPVVRVVIEDEKKETIVRKYEMRISFYSNFCPIKPNDLF